MKHRLFVLIAAMAVAGCHRGDTPAAANDSAANITALDANTLPPDANITDIPADDGDAPAEPETNSK